MSSKDRKRRLERFFAAHHESGLPVTTQRRAVFEAIVDRTDHPTAEQLHRAGRRRPNARGAPAGTNDTLR